MKLGVSYNAFDDCIEHLEDSIKSIREAVEYVSVVYQKVSNYGQKGAPETLDLLKSLHKSGLIDECFMFEPHLPIKNRNEVNKRNLGIKTCRDAKCTHFMTIDCDEYYRAEQLNRAKGIILDGDYDSSACQMQTYWKESWRYRLTPPEDYYVSLIFKMTEHLNFIYGLPEFGVLVDPSRRSGPGKQRIFKRDEIEMHHMSYVRDNIRDKFESSSAKGNWATSIDQLTDYYNNWKFPEKILKAGQPVEEHTVIDCYEDYTAEQ
jgi:hypothetical protein